MLRRLHQFGSELIATPGRKNRFILISTAIGLLANIATWLLILTQLRPILYGLPTNQSFVPLHYNIYFGVDNFGPWQMTFIMPGAGLLILIVNTVLGLHLFNRNKLHSYFLAGLASAIQIFILIATALVILINI